MSIHKRQTRQRYGQWAVVAGASEGLGAAFAYALAAEGHDLVLIARRESVLRDLATAIGSAHHVQVECVCLELAVADLADQLSAILADRDIGVAVYNAAYSFSGPLLENSLDDALLLTDVNVRGPLQFVHAVAPGMIKRGRGAVVIMSSLAGFTGTPTIATYAASKAFLTTLGEGLWAELKPLGVDVLVSVAGAIRTPNYLSFRANQKDAPGTMDPSQVAANTLGALGHGPIVIPGAVNKIASVFLRRVVPRKVAISIMAKSVKGNT